MHKDLNRAIHVPFAKVYLDPNNPRVAPEERPGYDNPSHIFDDAIQDQLNGRMEEVYNVPQLEHAIACRWTGEVVRTQSGVETAGFVRVRNLRGCCCAVDVADQLPPRHPAANHLG